MAEKALAHELIASNGAPNAEYYLALGRLQTQQKQFAEAEENIRQAMALQHQVIILIFLLFFFLSYKIIPFVVHVQHHVRPFTLIVF